MGFRLRRRESDRSRKLGSDYRKLLAATFGSSLGTGLHILAFPLLATTLTIDPRIIASLAATSSVPSLLLALPAGGLIDRSPKARLMVACDSACVLLMALLVGLQLTHELKLWSLFCIAALLGLAELFSGTSAFALLPSLIDSDKLVEANGYLSTATQTGSGIIGPAIGGVVYSVARTLPFIANGISYLLSASLIGSFAWRPSGQGDEPQPKRADALQQKSYRRDLLEGLSFVRDNHNLRTLLVLGAGSSLFGWMPEATFVLYARETLRLTDRQYGILLALTPLGAVVGGVLTGRLFRRLPLPRLLITTYVTYGLLLIPPAFVISGVVVGIVLFIQGIPIIAFASAGTSLRQTIIPAPLLGRVSSIFRIFNSCATTLGLTLGGLLGAWLGIRWTWAVAGAGFLLVLLLRAKDIPDLARAHHAS